MNENININKSKYWIISDSEYGDIGIEFDRPMNEQSAITYYKQQYDIDYLLLDAIIEAYPVTKSELYLSNLDIL